MSTWMIFWWLYSICFLFNLGTIFAFTTKDPEYKAQKFSYSQHLCGSLACAFVLAFFLIMGIWITFVVTDNAKSGWTLIKKE